MALVLDVDKDAICFEHLGERDEVTPDMTEQATSLLGLVGRSLIEPIVTHDHVMYPVNPPLSDTELGLLLDRAWQ